MQSHGDEYITLWGELSDEFVKLLYTVGSIHKTPLHEAPAMQPGPTKILESTLVTQILPFQAPTAISLYTTRSILRKALASTRVTQRPPRHRSKPAPKAFWPHPPSRSAPSPQAGCTDTTLSMLLSLPGSSPRPDSLPALLLTSPVH